MESEPPSKNRYSNSTPSDHTLYSLLMAGCIEPSSKLNTYNLKKIVRQINTQSGPRHSSILASKAANITQKKANKRGSDKRTKSSDDPSVEKPFSNRLESLFNNRMLIIQKSTLSSFDTEHFKKRKSHEGYTTPKTPVTTLPPAQVRRPRNTAKRLVAKIPIKA